MNITNILQYNQSQANMYINQLDQNELVELRGQIFGSLFWFKQRASFNSLSKKDAAYLSKLDRKLKARIKSGRAKPELTEHGSTIIRSSTQSDCAYSYFNLFHRGELGWFEMYSPANYFVAWNNYETLKVLTYCEGSVTLLICPDVKTYDNEVLASYRWFRDNY